MQVNYLDLKGKQRHLLKSLEYLENQEDIFFYLS